NVQEKNLLGNGQTLGFRWDFGGTSNLSLNFKEPRLFNTKTSFGLNFYDRVSQREEDEYTEKRQGGSISLGHPLSDTWDGLLKFKLENFQQDYFDDTVDDVSGHTRSMILQGHQNTSNHPFNPTDGSINTISLEYAGPVLGGDQEFTKYNLETRRFFKGFKEDHAWALRLKTGFGSGDIPELEKYHLGGSESLRCYKSYEFNGDDMLLMNLEYRFPIVDKFIGVAFVDAGDVKDTFDDIRLDQLYHSYGLGVRMNTPLGQIRLDYGWNDDGIGMPQFSIGQTF
ncbi:MAG: BamA/OMP85 family outer membrane protein, partial [Halanaerobiales bacterium]